MSVCGADFCCARVPAWCCTLPRQAAYNGGSCGTPVSGHPTPARANLPVAPMKVNRCGSAPALLNNFRMLAASRPIALLRARRAAAWAGQCMRK